MTLPITNFGVEIEFITTVHTRATIASKINAAGVPCRQMEYNHSTQPIWKIVTDGSLSNGGFELVSPILSGEDGLEQIRKISAVLIENDCTVNQTCGLHVHIDANAMPVDHIKKIVQKYNSNEMTINKFFKAERANNSFCRSSTFLNDLVSIDTPEKLKSKVGSDYWNRYYKVNIKSYARYGTIEFRQHHGTLNAEAITNWIKFLLYFTKYDGQVETVAKTNLSPNLFTNGNSRRIYNWLMSHNYTLNYQNYLAENPYTTMGDLRAAVVLFRRDLNTINTIYNKTLDLQNARNVGYYIPINLIDQMTINTPVTQSPFDMNLYAYMPKDLKYYFHEKTF